MTVRKVFALGCIFIGFIFSLIGGNMLFIKAAQAAEYRQQAADGRLAETTDFNIILPGRYVTLCGELEGETGSDSSSRLADYAQNNRLVIYRVEEWDVYEDSDEQLQGEWEEIALVLPDEIQIEGGGVPVSAAEETWFYGIFHTSYALVRGTGRFVEGESEGAQRVLGFQSGEMVCAFGRKTEARQLELIALNGGSFEGLLEALNAEAQNTRVVGSVFFIIGLALLGVGIVLALWKRLAALFGR